MTNKGGKKIFSTKTLLSSVLILITACYTFFTWRMTELMQETNRAELRPYLYIKFLKQSYFYYDGDDNKWKLLYTLTNNGKVSSTEIIRSYKVYKITGDKAIINRPTYVNIDFVYALAPQETLEGQPDQIDGISFSEKDISDGSYYLIELYVSYRGTESDEDTTYYSMVEIKIQPLSLNNGNWKYALYLMHRDEGIDQNLEKLLEWRDANNPGALDRIKYLNQIYRESVGNKILTKIQRKSNMMGTGPFDNSFYTFISTFAQSIAALFALFGIFLIFRFEWENQKLFRAYDSAKHAVIKEGGQPHLACLDKDVKFYLFRANCQIPKEYGSRDIRIQIHNLEEVRHSAYKSIFFPSSVFGILFIISIASLTMPAFFNNQRSISLLGYYVLLLLGLIWSGLTLFFKAHKLARDANELTFNTPNPYEKYESESKLRKSTFLHLTESIDLIERDILEFTDYPFIMNFAFRKAENAIRRRKSQLKTLNDLEKMKYITTIRSFLIEATNDIPANKLDEVNKAICAENKDRSQIIAYVTNKYPECKNVISDLFLKIHTEIKTKLKPQGKS